MIAFLGAILMIELDTGGTVWVKFTLYVLLFIAFMKRIVVIAGVVLAIPALVLVKRRAKPRHSSPAH
ncbi:MAG: hypothetical protein ONB46_09005 [candidate division KSB1 bacterium]|nr:hypothetical protein [candidate division KSB1 bacterium]MDZ7365837.1 hypothetical protein [candidate division KSB1 bacterium]MDZ7403928.1 hypothetical protein [candidate division KSB1 bacterium]